MLKTNKEKVVVISVEGKIQHPGKNSDFITDSYGKCHVRTATGGICYNVKVGDCCMDLSADHTEPGVTTSNDNNDFECSGYAMYSCIGNKARVMTGLGESAVGYVTGKHDFCNIMVYFDDITLQKLAPDDKILVEGCGQGLKIEGYPQVEVMNIDPELLENLGITEKDGKLIVPVAKKIPAYLMGSGLGASSSQKGDYDIMTQDRKTIQKLGLEDMRFGDIVLLEDCDTCYGRGYFKGAVTIGVIIHGDCIKPGHGPGVTTIMSTRQPIIEGVIDENANIANYHPLTKK